MISPLSPSDQTAYAAFDQAIAEENTISPDYKLVLDENGVLIYKFKPSNGDPAIIKSYVTFEMIPPATLAKLLFRDEIRQKYDEPLESFGVLESRGDFECIYYMVINPPMALISRRDFVTRKFDILNYKGAEEIVVMTSCDHHLKPAQSSPVRGTMHNNTRIVRPNPSGPGSVLFCIMQMDMGGNIPSGIMESKATDMPKEMKSRIIQFYKKCQSTGELL